MKKDAVLLLYPKTGIDPVRPQPPLSLLALAPYIEQRGLTPVVVDQRVDKGYKEKIKGLLPRALFAGVTSMTGEQIGHALGLVRLVKGLSPETPVVFGGVHASLMPEQTAMAEGIDIVAAGEGEGVVAEIADYYAGNAPIGGVRGIYYRDGGRVVSTTPRGPADIGRLMTPAWHLIDTGRYTDFTVLAGRGCPHACTFCYNARVNRRMWRARRPEAIAEEIGLLCGRGVRDFQFVDDNFFSDFGRVEALCALIVEKGLSVRWKASCRADYFKRLTPRLCGLLKRSGLRLLFVGAESGSPAVLEKIRKGISVEDIVSAARVSKRYALPTSMSFMLGFPFEAEEDRSMTYALMDRVKGLNPDISIEGANIYTPYPGNELYEEAVRRGFREPASLAGWAGFVYNVSNLPWFSASVSRTVENVSFIARFAFWEREIRERFLRGSYYPFYWLLRLSALARWRSRAFRHAPEWDLFRFVRKNCLR